MWLWLTLSKSLDMSNANMFVWIWCWILCKAVTVLRFRRVPSIGKMNSLANLLASSLRFPWLQYDSVDLWGIMLQLYLEDIRVALWPIAFDGYSSFFLPPFYLFVVISWIRKAIPPFLCIFLPTKDISMRTFPWDVWNQCYYEAKVPLCKLLNSR